MSLLDTIKFIAAHPLNHGRQLSAIARFAKWQVGSRLIQGGIVYDWANSSRFLVRSGETGLTGNIYTGLHEFADMGFLLHFLRNEDLFVDVGANLGSYSILACAAIGARGIAFEPVPSTFSRLVENMRLNNLDERLRCVRKGVSAQQGVIAFTSGMDATNHALASGEQCDDKVTVETTSLDAALRGENPALIKIDVEGYETLVLAGAREVLDNQGLSAVIMELNGSGARYGFDESGMLDLMLGHGFGTYSYSPLDRSLISLGGKNLNAGNTLFIRNRPFVEDRLRLAPKVSVHGRQF
ncbi:MAG: FkbM family methyltransferase [Lysobacter sp.]|nr:FkbM family methyltransferase [Lysobacter sp.]